MAVDDSKEFHKKNLSKNKDHYTVISRYSRALDINLLFTNFGAKIHFNEVSMKTPEYMKMLEDSDEEYEEEIIRFRYGVITMDNLLRDLKYWETLAVSSMMQRPIKPIIICEKHPEIWETHTSYNLKSAIAYAALTTHNGFEERDLYTSVVEIP